MDESKNMRDSNFELLRIISMLSIVFYHLLLFKGNDLSNNFWLFDASTKFFHFGVCTFVLISGYFGINLSVKRILNIYIPVVFYTLILSMIYGWNDALTILTLSDKSPLWFIQPYIYLCILAPYLNLIINNIEGKKEEYCKLLGLFLFLVVIMGFILGNSIGSGHSLMNFIFIYFVGRFLNMKKIYLPTKYIIISIIIIAIIIYGGKYSGSFWGDKAAGAFYAYNSPLGLLFSVFILLLFKNLALKSTLLNYIAKSSFAVYLIGSNPAIIKETESLVECIMLSNSNLYGSFVLIFFLAFSITMGCLLVDIILRNLYIPIIRVINNSVLNCLE